MTLYFANPTTLAIPHMVAGTLGWIDTPNQGNSRPPGTVWCADNGCFNDKKFNVDKWFAWLQSHPDREHCVFATAPDVVGDAEATLARSTPWLPTIRALGFPVAYVAQDGSDEHPPPWDDFDALFIGGTDDFKLGPVARQLVTEAKRRGKWAHMGRVNSLKRLRYAEAIGCDSADGTYLVFAPTENLANVLHWVSMLDTQKALF